MPARAERGAGFRIGIAGNQPAAAEAILRELDAPVDVVASSATWGVGSRRRSSSRACCRRRGCRRAELAYVGDRVDNDVVPAAAAGMVAVHVRRGPWGHLQADWPEAALAAIRVRSLGDLPAALVARR